MDKVTQIYSISSPFDVELSGEGLCCAIVDGAFDDNLQGQIYRNANNGSPIWMSLTLNTPYADLGKQSPCLVRCAEHPGLMRYTSELLAQSNAGCVVWLEQDSDWPLAVRHCQSLLAVMDERHSRSFFRFFEPRWLEPLFSVLSAKERLDFLGPFRAMSWRNELGWRHIARLESWTGKIQEPGWFHMNALRQQQLEEARLSLVAVLLADSYRSHLPESEPEHVVLAQLQKARAAGYTALAEQERWLRLYLSRPPGFLDSVLAQQTLSRKDIARGEKLSELEKLNA